jgi:hypothetical protein
MVWCMLNEITAEELYLYVIPHFYVLKFLIVEFTTL